MNIHFFRSGKTYYFTFENKEYIVSDITLNRLMSQLKLPFTCSFDGLSIAQIEKICGKLKFNNTECYFYNSNGEIKVNFYESKYQIDTYLISDKNCLYGRNTNCKPYILCEFDDRKVLIEVSFYYANNCKEDIYFLHEELTEYEREFFSSLHKKIEVEHVYRFHVLDDNVLIRKKGSKRI